MLKWDTPSITKLSLANSLNDFFFWHFFSPSQNVLSRISFINLTYLTWDNLKPAVHTKHPCSSMGSPWVFDMRDIVVSDHKFISFNAVFAPNRHPSRQHPGFQCSFHHPCNWILSSQQWRNTWPIQSFPFIYFIVPCNRESVQYWSQSVVKIIHHML